jgi:hypothetical protein
MSVRYLFIPFLIFAVSAAGCTRDRLSSADVAVVPPYWQSQSQLAQSQFEEMRKFHEKESAKMSEDIHTFRNSKTERLAATGKEMKNDQQQQENRPKPPALTKTWASWFKKKDNNDNAPLVSTTSHNVR